MWRRREAEWEREKVAREKLMNEVSTYIRILCISLTSFASFPGHVEMAWK